jgi:hypothetical protein
VLLVFNQKKDDKVFSVFLQKIILNLLVFQKSSLINIQFFLIKFL